MRNKHSRCRSATFTLLELLATVVITAVLLSALLGPMRGIMQLRRQEERHTQDDIRLQRTLDILSADLRHMLPTGSPLVNEIVGEYGEEDGFRADSLDLVTAVHPPTEDRFGGSAARVVLSLLEDDDDALPYPNLVREVYSNLLATETEEPEQIVLLDRVRGLTFTYYDGSDWVDSWDTSLQEEELPEAVIVRLERQPDDSDDEEEVVARELLVPILQSPMTEEADDSGRSGTDEGETP